MTPGQRSAFVSIGISLLAGIAALPGVIGAWWLSRPGSLQWVDSTFGPSILVHFRGYSSELYSHLFNLLFMGTGALVVGWTVFLKSRLRPKHPLAVEGIWWLPVFILLYLAIWVGGMDGQHGGGRSMESFTLLFAPTLTACGWFLSGAALDQLTTWHSAMICLGVIASVWFAQLVFEPSNNGYPNTLALLFCPGLIFGCYLIRRFNPHRKPAPKSSPADP